MQPTTVTPRYFREVIAAEKSSIVMFDFELLKGNIDTSGLLIIWTGEHGAKFKTSLFFSVAKNFIRIFKNLS